MTHSILSQAVLMAAGLGTRLQPFTHSTPKAIIPVMGVPVAQFALDSLVQAGVTKTVANVHHHAQSAIQGLLKLDRKDTELLISDESNLLLGSGGGVRKASECFGSSPFFLANADVLCEVDWKGLANHHLELRKKFGVTLTLTVFPVGPRLGEYREIIFDPKTHLIRQLGKLEKGKPFFVGAAVIEPEALALIPLGSPAEFVSSILEPAIQKQTAGVFQSSGEWFDIGAPPLWLETHLELIRQFEYSFPSGSLETFHKSATIKRWRERIETVSQRLDHEIWISKAPNLSSQKISSIQSLLKGPCYWQCPENQVVQGRLDSFLGPEAVVYGELPPHLSLVRGIGMNGHWIHIS